MKKIFKMYIQCHRKRCYCISDEVQTSPLKHYRSPEVAARSKGKWLGKRSKLCLFLWLNRKRGVEKSQYPDKMKSNKSCLLGVSWLINHSLICAKYSYGKEGKEGGSGANQGAWAPSKLFNKQKCAFALGICDASSHLPCSVPISVTGEQEWVSHVLVLASWSLDTQDFCGY